MLVPPAQTALEADASAQRALEEYIRSLPPGPERDELIAQMMRRYEPRQTAAATALETANDRYDDALGATPEMRSGPKDNPFARDVAANPLEFVAHGLRGYQAGRERDRARDTLEREFAGEEAIGQLDKRVQLEANALADELAQKERLGGAAPGTVGGLTPEEEAELMARGLRGGAFGGYA